MPACTGRKERRKGRRADAELKTASARTVPRAIHGHAFRTGIALPVVVLGGRMRNLKKEAGKDAVWT